MFDIATIKSIAVSTVNSLVSWTQSTKAGAVVVDTKNKTSRAGLSYEQGSRIVSVSNVQNSIEDPLADADAVNLVLSGIAKDAFAKTCHAIFNEDDLIDEGLLFKYETDTDEQDYPSEDSFVGFEIDLCKSTNFTLILSRIMANFVGDQSVKILLFSSQKKDPIYEVTISALEFDTVEEEVYWLMSNYKYGGKFYLGYLTAGMTQKPLARDFELANLPSSFQGVFIQPIQVVHNSETMFDPNDIVYSDSSTSWGLNFDFQGYEDWTQTIKSNERRFARCLQLAVAVDVADLLLNSVRSNSVETINKAAIVFELSGNVNNQKMPEKIGLFKQLAEEEEKLRQVFKPDTGVIRSTIQR